MTEYKRVGGLNHKLLLLKSSQARSPNQATRRLCVGEKPASWLIRSLLDPSSYGRGALKCSPVPFTGVLVPSTRSCCDNVVASQRPSFLVPLYEVGVRFQHMNLRDNGHRMLFITLGNFAHNQIKAVSSTLTKLNQIMVPTAQGERKD